ncbi:MAG: thiamine phosphate synthase [Pirellulales bacterium]|nr:thiamine phosphate synthase [Pirellulales bacterium]
MPDSIHLPPVDVLRIVDAEANRAGEGLRVVEDYVRFVLDDRHLTEQVKQLRHDLEAALRPMAMADRLAARESLADVGADISTRSESDRTDAASVAAASFKRTQQALRALEEYTKLVDTTAARQVESLRYRFYTLERAAVIAADAIARLADARLYVLVDGQSTEAEFVRLIETLVAAGVDAIQLRDKRLVDRELLNRARQLRALTSGSSTLFVMNDRPDLAALSRADGVHVGQDDSSVKNARSIVGTKMLIGVSTHSIEQARKAVLDGANYIGIGPAFPSGTKSFDEFVGAALLGQVAVEIRLPTFAIGGITRENLPQVLAAGIDRVAVSGAVVKAADITAGVRSFQTLLGR